MMSFFAILFIAGIIVLVVWAIRAASAGSAPDERERQRDTALEEVRRRYAAGEITREEYEVLERDLRR